jgi:Sulfotransferase domain
MSLNVIGAGMGRTGTMSLKLALERIGFGPCYHGSDLASKPHDWPLWQDAIDGELRDFEQIFRDYASVADAPGWYFFQQLSDRYPDAKVILTVRDPNAWFESTQATVLSDRIGTMLMSAPKPLFSIVHTMFLRSAGTRMHDRNYMIDWFERHNEGVRRAISPDRLLTYEVTQGWEPLCRFLGVPLPGEPFPRSNERKDLEKFVRAKLDDIG